MKILPFFGILLAGLAHAAGPAPMIYSGGDGSSAKTAIVILGARDDSSATRAEYVYLARRYPHYDLIRQSLLSQDNKDYDLLEFKDTSGARHSIYFDITVTFEKLNAEINSKTGTSK